MPYVTSCRGRALQSNRALVCTSDMGMSDLLQTQVTVRQVEESERDLLQMHAVPPSHIAHLDTARAAQAAF